MNQKKSYKDLIFAWAVIDVSLPVFFIAVFWPISEWFLKKSHSFVRVFHSADLMPLGALLLLAAIRELETEIQLGRLRTRCQKRRVLGQAIAVVLLFLYALCKYYSLTTDIPGDSRTEADYLLLVIAYLSIVTVVFCSLYSLFLKSSIYSQLD